MFWHRSQRWLMGRYCPWFFNTANEKNSNEDRDEIGGIFTFKNYPLREESSFWVYFTWIFWCTVSCWAISCVQTIVIGKRYSLEFRLEGFGSCLFCCSFLLLTKLPLLWSCPSRFCSVLQTRSSWPIPACHRSFEERCVQACFDLRNPPRLK